MRVLLITFILIGKIDKRDMNIEFASNKVFIHLEIFHTYSYSINCKENKQTLLISIILYFFSINLNVLGMSKNILGA